MAHHHVEKALELLRVGAPDGVEVSLADFDIPAEQVLSIPAEYVFDDEASYCCMCDIPDSIRSVGVHYTDSHAYIAGDNGDCLFIFRLSKAEQAPNATLLQIVQAGVYAVGAKPGEAQLDMLLAFAALRDMVAAEYNNGSDPIPERIESSIAAAKALGLWHWSNTETLQAKIEPFAEEFYPGS
jgi:hypothetical protein